MRPLIGALLVCLTCLSAGAETVRHIEKLRPLYLDTELVADG